MWWRSRNGESAQRMSRTRSNGVEYEIRMRERGEEVFDFRQVCQRTNVEAEIHELHGEKKCLHNAAGSLGKVLRIGENA